MTKADLTNEVLRLEKEIKRLEDIIRKPFEFTEEHTRICLKLNGKRLYITKPYDEDNRLDIHCETQLVILPNASNRFYIEEKQ